MQKKRKICVVSGSRADYGLLYWTLKSLKDNPFFDLHLIVTGMHLSSEFGSTYTEIEKDGFVISRKVDCLMSSDSPIAISKSIGSGIIRFSEAFSEIKPDVILVVGDRFEIYAAVVAAMPFCIPIAHCHGGEVTVGAIDEAIRHSITKMSHLHFVSTECYKQRVIQLGEDPKRIFLCGALGIENIKRLKLLDRRAIERQLGLKFSERNLLITYHPETLNYTQVGAQFKQLLRALSGLNNCRFIFTLPNADTGGRQIIKLINQFVAENSDRALSFKSLGTLRYLSMLKAVDVVVGNSSSGIIEAPSLKKPTVNIGIRQEGRVRADSIIDVPATSSAIRNAIQECFSLKFKKRIKTVKNPYDYGCPSIKIVNALKMIKLEGLVKKEFHDLY